MLKKMLLTAIAALFVTACVPASSAPSATSPADEGLISVESANSVDETARRLQNALEEKGLTVFAVIDHAGNAGSVDRELRPTKLILTGNPNLGTPLMQSNQTTGIDLPQKFLIWEHEDGDVFVTYNDPQYLAWRHDLDPQSDVMQTISKALQNFAGAAAAEVGPSAQAEIRDAEGRVVGNATLTATSSGAVSMRVEVSGFETAGAGAHGIHIHETGQCTPDFSAAGGHFNPTGAEHGLDNPQGPHAGDLPNMEFDADGNATYEVTTDRITLGSGQRSLFDADGSAIIIHAGADDQMTNPSGDSGARIACGVITQ